MSATIFAGGDPHKVDIGGYSKGEILAANSSGDLAALPIDIDGKVLTLDSVATLGVDWQAGGGGGGGVNSVFSRVGNVIAQVGDYSAFYDATGAAAAAQAAAIAASLNKASGGTVSGPVTISSRFVETPVNLSAAAASIATDASLGNAFRVTLGANGPYTLAAPSNPTDGQMAIWEIKQDGSGNRSFALATGAGAFSFGTDITSITVSTTAGATDLLGCRYNSTANRWWVIAFLKGF